MDCVEEHACNWDCYVDKYGINHHSDGTTSLPRIWDNPEPSEGRADV